MLALSQLAASFLPSSAPPSLNEWGDKCATEERGERKGEQDGWMKESRRKGKFREGREEEGEAAAVSSPSSAAPY